MSIHPTWLIDHSLNKMSRVNGDSAHPKCKIMATEKVTNPSNASMPILSSQQAVADAAEAKCLANARLLEPAAGAPTLAPGDTSASTTFFSDIARNKWNTDDAELSFSNTSADGREKSMLPNA